MTHRLFIVLVVALFAPLLALAQPAPAASAAEPRAYTEADITRDTDCGAEGVGKVWAGPRRGTIERREGRPGYKVSSDGYWATGCRMPEPPKDCPEKPAPSWLVGGYMCHPVEGRMIPGRNSPFQHDVWAGAQYRHTGYVRYSCQRKPDGSMGWVPVREVCGPRKAK